MRRTLDAIVNIVGELSHGGMVCEMADGKPGGAGSAKTKRVTQARACR